MTAWLNEQQQWNSTTKRNAITLRLHEGMNWACKNRGLDKNPLRGMEKPAAKRRIVVVTAKEFDQILKQTKEISETFSSSATTAAAVHRKCKQLEARHLQLDKKPAGGDPGRRSQREHSA